ncbi:MAG TPA: hypothetical protein VMU65_13775 [Candidatus Saccharimonadales bacterium]|jgi:hypothetical protein|nr:hypothetical protein [Candidatus Saccharimonadales bacterium]
MNRRIGFTLSRAGGLTGLGGVVALSVALMASQSVAAGGNPNFEGILSSATPTGFMSSPQAYDISGGPVTVDFDVAATNLTNKAQTVALHFSADHILTYNGVDVSDGQPGQAGITFTGPAGTTQAVVPGTQSFSDTWSPNGSKTILLTYTFDACGYYQLDVWAPWTGGGRDRATLASGFIRVLGCDASPTPTPTLSPSPSPSGGVGGATSTPTPDGGVQGITSTPSTGAGGGWLTLGAALVIAGVGMLVVGKRGRRVHI